MSKRRKIIIALCVLTVGVLVICVLVIGALGYSLFWRKGGDTEMGVFAPTEVGAPVGDKVTKVIGPAGGSIASPDGRLTLTVPQNALAETVTFSIQPVTNKFGFGLGLAYRLEPDGKTFTTPLEISVHYDEHDLEGTIPEALSLAYQDQHGAWHSQKSAKLDNDQKTVTISATHFSIWTVMSFWKLTPAKATIRVGESISLIVMHCDQNVFFRMLNGGCNDGWWYEQNTFWRLSGAGKLTADYPRMIYTAPNKKPTPNVATVVFSYPVERACPDSWHSGENCHITVKESLKSEITIIDRGYKASGKFGDTVFSGDICSLEQPFILKTNNPFMQSFEFVPSSPTAGKWAYSYKSGVAGGGGGQYTIEGTDTEKTGIKLNGSGTGTIPKAGTLTGSGAIHIDLVPLESNECDGK